MCGFNNSHKIQFQNTAFPSPQFGYLERLISEAAEVD